MAIELNINKVTTAVAGDSGVSKDQGAAQGAKLGSVLGGESLKVTSGATSDLEKLVARLKNENESTKLSVAQRRISILQTVLDSMADRVTAAERENLLKLEELNGQKGAAAAELAGLQADKAATEGRIAVLDAEIAALENQIKQAVEDGADHREQVAKLKAQRAEEQEKLDRIEGAIGSVSAKIADISVKISECTKAIGAATLSVVSAALRSAAGEETSAVERPESDAERRKAEAKADATDVAKHISDALDRIDAQILQAIAEAQELVKA